MAMVVYGVDESPGRDPSSKPAVGSTEAQAAAARTSGNHALIVVDVWVPASRIVGSMRPTSGPTNQIARWLVSGTIDAELGGLLWLLVEARVPVVVAGAAGSDRRGLRDAMTAFLPPQTATVALAGDDEDFAWMPEAVELGWRREDLTPVGRDRASASETVLVAQLEDGPGGTWGERARIAIRSLSVGYGMLATAVGGRLEDVFDSLTAQPVAATEDELARLGVVLILNDERGTERVVAAHYLRPVARDPHGHVQRMPPAVVATWDPASGRFEHFAWGITAELADRIGMRPVDLEREQASRGRSALACASA